MGYCHIESYTGENVSRGIPKRENDVVHFDHWADPFVRLLLVKISGCALTVVKNGHGDALPGDALLPRPLHVHVQILTTVQVPHPVPVRIVQADRSGRDKTRILGDLVLTM